jgi:hypothetical protein
LRFCSSGLSCACCRRSSMPLARSRSKRASWATCGCAWSSRRSQTHPGKARLSRWPTLATRRSRRPPRRRRARGPRALSRLRACSPRTRSSRMQRTSRLPWHCARAWSRRRASASCASRSCTTSCTRCGSASACPSRRWKRLCWPTLAPRRRPSRL